MADARITTIAAEIKTLIDAMSVAGGYHYNWATPNEPDKALQPAFPVANIRYYNETAADGINGIYGMQNAEFTITVDYKITPSATVKPEYTADAILDNCLADLRKLFQAQVGGYLPLSGEAVLTFKSSEKVVSSRGNTFRPVQLVTKWNCFYHNS